MVFQTSFLESDHIPVQTLCRESTEEKQAADRGGKSRQMRKVIQPGRIDVGPWGLNAAVPPSICFLSYAGCWQELMPEPVRNAQGLTLNFGKVSVQFKWLYICMSVSNFLCFSSHPGSTASSLCVLGQDPQTVLPIAHIEKPVQGC